MSENTNRLAATCAPGWIWPLLLVLACALSGCSSNPQFVDDPDCFRAVDALYTAIGSRSLQLVGDCETNLNTLKSSGKLSPAAHEKLQSIIALARKKEWRPAAEQLSALIRAQRATTPAR